MAASQGLLEDLPTELLAQIVQHLHYRTRIGCELVSKRFREVCTEICVGHAYQWTGLPKRMNLVIENCELNIIQPMSIDGDRVKIQIPYIRSEADPGRLHTLLRRVLQKLSGQIGSLELCTFDISADVMQLIDEYAPSMDRIKLCRCTFVDVPAALILKHRAKITSATPYSTGTQLQG